MIEIRNNLTIPIRTRIVKVKATGNIFVYIDMVEDESICQPNYYCQPTIEETDY